MITKPVYINTLLFTAFFSHMEQLKTASITYQPPLAALKHLVNSPGNYTSDREWFVLCNDNFEHSGRFCLYCCDHCHAPTHGIVLKSTLVVNLCLYHCSLQTPLAVCDVTYMWVTWGEPLSQEISSPGKTAVPAKLPRIYCHSSITEWPYFLGNIVFPQDNLSNASYMSECVVTIQELSY